MGTSDFTAGLGRGGSLHQNRTAPMPWVVSPHIDEKNLVNKVP